MVWVKTSFFTDLGDSIFFPASVPTNLLAFKQSYTSDSHSSGKKKAGNVVSGWPDTIQN